MLKLISNPYEKAPAVDNRNTAPAPSQGLLSGRRQSRPQSHTTGRPKNMRALRKQLSRHEPHVGRALRQAAQVPRVPGVPPRDQVAHRKPLARQAKLLVGADPVQDRKSTRLNS